MKCLVTGGAGFIGAHLARQLAELGHTVVILDDFNDYIYPAWLKRERVVHLLSPHHVEVVEGSVLNADLLETTFKKYGFTHVFHGAAHANPNVAAYQEAPYTDVNLGGTLCLLQHAQRHRVERFILASSASVYSDEETPFRESYYSLNPLTVYGASKAAAEIYGRMWHERYGLPVVILRLFSTYGPWGRPDMAPMIFSHKLITDQVITVNRDKRWRDFTHVSDIVDGSVAALTSSLPFGVFNIGRGEPTTLHQFIATLEKITGKKAVLEGRDSPPGEMRITYADISEATRELGYSPHVSLEQGVQQLVEWMQNWYLPAYQKESLRGGAEPREK